MKSCLFLIVVAATQLLPVSGHCACFQPQPRLVCGEYFDSELIVEATLAQIGGVRDPDYAPAYLSYDYTLQVDKPLLGKSGATIHVFEGNDTSRAGFSWVKGRKYLLFLSYSDEVKALMLDGCGNSGPLRKAGKALAQIAAIQEAQKTAVQTSHNSGWIRGELNDQSEGIRIVAVGSAGVFSTESGKHGIFNINVPVGQFTLHAVDPDGVFKYTKYELSYADPNNIHIVAGSCAQVEFVQTDANSSPPK